MSYPFYQPYQQQYQTPYQQPLQQPAQQQGIIWIQGEAAAKSYLVAPGQNVLLMDAESNCFYLKAADQSGMPLPLRVFDYTERTARAPETAPEYITRKEFEEALARIKEVQHAE